MSLPFTPQDVIAAYEKTGLMPTRNEWASYTNGVKCGCALTALYVSKAEDQGEAFEKILEFSINYDDAIEEMHGYDTRLVRMFIGGFDGEITRSSWGDELFAAHMLGAETWQSVKTHFGIEGRSEDE